MHLIIMVIFGIPLVVMFFALTIWALAQLIMEGIANDNAGTILAGLTWFIIVWGGLFAIFGHS
ncbi:hypothetical protein ACI7BZ_11480 [Xanthobacter sp. AM11]|uniref:hypothetical protein n=1 Tax=Xanthobacter sp. AM11 TaxID=3380643 RepID=UPI0039BEE768